jgi:hypothetical protein
VKSKKTYLSKVTHLKNFHSPKLTRNSPQAKQKCEKALQKVNSFNYQVLCAGEICRIGTNFIPFFNMLFLLE